MTKQNDASTIAGWLRQYGRTGQLPPEAGTYMDLFSEDVAWTVMGSGLEYTRTYLGKKTLIAEYMDKLYKKIDMEKTVIKQEGLFLDVDQQVIITHNSETLILANGKTLDVDSAFIMKVAGGLIISVSEFLDLRPIEAEFGPSLDDFTPQIAPALTEKTD